MMPDFIISAALIPICITTALAARPPARPLPARDALPATSPSDPLPREALLTLYQRELDKLYRAEDAEKLLDSHRLIESYFATNSANERAALVTRIEQLGVDANILGRITRIRMNWPDLRGKVFYVNERLGSHPVHYFLGLPAKYDRTTAWPLYIKLPAEHALLTDPKPTADQIVKIYEDSMKEELSKHTDAVVIMPLINVDEPYGPGQAGMNSVIYAMHHAADKANIDPTHVYMLGHSMAAQAVWNLGMHYPTYFAAVAPLAGAASGDWQRVRLMNFLNVLPVVWHDSEDKVLKVEESRGPVAALKRYKIDVDYEETKGVGHAPSEAIGERVYQKLRARTRTLYPQQAWIQSNRMDTLFNRSDWIQMYQPLNPGADKRLLLYRGSGFIVVSENSWKVQAQRAGNRIDIAPDNVEVMRVYLNDQMIDFGKPVSIAVNKKLRLEGMLKPSVDEMLKDQVFLGRGWRYYTAVIDLDLVARPATSTSPSTAATTRDR